MAASLVRRRIVNAWPGRLAGLTLLLGFGSADVCAIELIENGSFEDAEHIGIAGWDNGSGVGNDIGFTAPLYPFFFGGQVEYGELSFESPPNRPPDFSGTLKPFGGGNSFGRSWGAANGNGRGGSATQIVDIGLLADRRFTFSAWMASFRDDPEYAILSLEFFTGPGGAGESIESIVFDGSDQGSEFIVGSMNLDGMADPMIPATDDNWTLYRAAGTIPSAADSAAVVIRGISPPGSSTSGNDGFVDLVSLQVVPEPATAGLLIGGILACAAVLRRLK